MKNFAELASSDSVLTATKNLEDNGFIVRTVETKEEAMEAIKSLIPKGSSVMNGASTTLNQIGFLEYLKSGDHGWNNLHANILAEQDKEKQNKLRKESVLSDYYLGSAHAVTETGEVLVASNTGSQLPHLAFTSTHIILVVSTKKIAKNLDEAMKRIDEYVVPLEDQRMKSVGYPGTMYSKLLILKKENKMMGREFVIVFVNEDLGF